MRPSPTFLSLTNSVAVPPLPTPPPSYLNSTQILARPEGSLSELVTFVAVLGEPVVFVNWLAIFHIERVAADRGINVAHQTPVLNQYCSIPLAKTFINTIGTKRKSLT